MTQRPARVVYGGIMRDFATRTPAPQYLGYLGLRPTESRTIDQVLLDSLETGTNRHSLETTISPLTLDIPAAQSFLRSLNHFILASKFERSGRVLGLLKYRPLQDAPPRKRIPGEPRLFGAISFSETDGSTNFILDLGGLNESATKSVMAFLGARLLTLDFSGYEPIAPLDHRIIPQFNSRAEIAQAVAERFGLTQEQGMSFVDNYQTLVEVNDRDLLWSAANFLPLWDFGSERFSDESLWYQNQVGKVIVNRIARGEVAQEDFLRMVADYAKTTRLAQYHHRSLIPESLLVTQDNTLVPVPEGMPKDIDPNYSRGNVELSFKPPAAPVVSREWSDEEKEHKFVAIRFDMTFEEKQELVKSFSERLLKKQAGGMQVKKAAGAHGHELVIAYDSVFDVSDVEKVFADQENEYIVTNELDGLAREYGKDGKPIRSLSRGGSVESTGSRAIIRRSTFQPRFEVAEEMGLMPHRAGGGGHYTNGMEHFIRHAQLTGTAAATARMIFFVHRFQAVLGMLFMHPNRINSAMPFYFQHRVDGRIPSKEQGFEPFRTNHELLEFEGSFDYLMKKLVDTGYFNQAEGRKMKYLFMNLLQLLANYLHPDQIGPDFDVKNEEWQSEAPVKGNRDTREMRGWDAPLTLVEAELMVFVMRSIDLWALQMEKFPEHVTRSETYIDYGYFAEKPHEIFREFNQFMDILGVDVGRRQELEILLAERMVDIQFRHNNGMINEVERRQTDQPYGKGFKPGLLFPRTSEQTKAILKTKTAAKEALKEQKELAAKAAVDAKIQEGLAEVLEGDVTPMRPKEDQPTEPVDESELPKEAIDPAAPACVQAQQAISRR